MKLCVSFRDSLAAQLEITLTKADSEQLARSIAEEQYSDLEKEKIMKELELKEMMARHRQELSEKDITISSVNTLALLKELEQAEVPHTAPWWSYRELCSCRLQLEEANRTLTSDVANLANEKEELNNKLKDAREGHKLFKLTPGAQRGGNLP